jgi:hypothetical protein
MPPGCIFFMHLFYLDDSGSPQNANEEYLVLGGISVFEAQAHFLTTKLDELALSICPQDPQSVEFHASEIYARRSAPWSGLGRDEAKGVIKAVLKIFADYCYDTAKAFACVVHKRSYPGQDPLQLAFEDMCSRFDQYLSNLRGEGDRQRGLIILDRSAQETTLQNMARNFRVLGTQWGVIRNLADTPFFVDSRASRVVQLADHIAYSVFRRFNSGDAQYFDIISSRFYASEGIVHGLAHKQRNIPDCMCIACQSRRSR